MLPNLCKRVKLLIGLAIPTVIVGGCISMELLAESRARSFCERITIGSDFGKVITAATNAGDNRHRVIGPDNVVVTYIGIPPFSRHACIVDGLNGKVTATRYHFTD